MNLLSPRRAFGALILSVATAAPAFANEVMLNTTPYSDPVYSGGNLVGYGGEFTATATGVGLGQYKSGISSLSAGTFETFCVELNQDISANTEYNYTLSNHVDFNDGVGEPLAIGVAWLYSNFVSGTLAGYSYATSTGAQQAARLTSSSELQNAIWQLMQETYNVSPNAPDPSTVVDYSNPFIQDALGQFGSIGAAEAASNGAYGVKVMDLYSGSTKLQDQLVKVPDAVSTWLLIALAAVTLGLGARLARPGRLAALR